MNNFLYSSLGKKIVMAATGLFLCIFLLEHLYTNLMLFYGDGGESFNEASHWMVHNLIIRIVEFVLFFAILAHVMQAIRLTKENAAARPVKYAVSGVSVTSNWFSRNMGFTGSMIFFFIVVHLYNFFVPYRVAHSVGNDGQLTLAESVSIALANPAYAFLYLIAVLFLCMHLNHGFQSAFQTLGMNNKKYAQLWKKAGTAFALLMFIGYASFPVLFFLSDMLGWDLLNWAK